MRSATSSSRPKRLIALHPVLVHVHGHVGRHIGEISPYPMPLLPITISILHVSKSPSAVEPASPISPCNCPPAGGDLASSDTALETEEQTPCCYLAP